MLTLAILTTLTLLGDTPPQGITRTYDISAAKSRLQGPENNIVLLPYLESSQPAQDNDPLHGDAEIVVETLRGLCPQEWDSGSTSVNSCSCARPHPCTRR